MTSSPLKTFAASTVLTLCALASGTIVFLIIQQPASALALNVSSLFAVLTLSSLGGLLLLAYAASYSLTTPRYTAGYVIITAIYFIGLVTALIFGGERVSIQDVAVSLERFAPESEHAALLRRTTTLGEWGEAYRTYHAINKAPVKGEALFKMLLGIQSASTHPAWHDRMEDVAKNGVLFDDDLRWMVNHIQEETRQGRAVNTQALSLLSER